MAALHGEFTPKFVATQDASGKPNVVPIISLDAADERTCIFAELFIWKTRDNLQADPRVGIAVVTENLRAWTLRGRLREFVEGGPYVERMNQKEMFRYNAYVGVGRVGVIDVEEVTTDWKRSTLDVAAELLQVKAVRRVVGRHGFKAVPPRVAEKFARTRAVKVLAYQGPLGHPNVVPAFSLLPTRSETMVFSMGRMPEQVRGLRAGTQVAAAVITFDPIAYQIKGIFTGQRRTPAGRIGEIRVEEVYSASPPLAGEPIVLQDIAQS
jgi:hypothetical protein